MGWRLPMFWNKSPIKPEYYVGSDEPHNEEVVRERFAAKAKRYLRQMPLAHETVAMYFCLLDPATPIWVKATAAAALAYFILPFDAVPDFLPIVGLSDDASVLAAALDGHRGAHHRRASHPGSGVDGRRDRGPGEGPGVSWTLEQCHSRPTRHEESCPRRSPAGAQHVTSRRVARLAGPVADGSEGDGVRPVDHGLAAPGTRGEDPGRGHCG